MSDLKKEDLEHLISLWETLSGLWEATAARHKEEGNLETAAICQARKFTFWRCAQDLRAMTNIYGPVPEPPPTIPGMHWEEHETIEKTLTAKSSPSTQIVRPPQGFWKKLFSRKATNTGPK